MNNEQKDIQKRFREILLNESLEDLKKSVTLGDVLKVLEDAYAECRMKIVLEVDPEGGQEDALGDIEDQIRKRLSRDFYLKTDESSGQITISRPNM